MKNIRKIAGLALAGLIMTSMAVATPVQASTTSIPKNYSYNHYTNAPIPYYYTGKNKNAYIWNYSHTKKIHNLKNYPNTIWLVTNANVKTVKGKRAVYYKMYSSYNPKVKGLVWAGYLAKNIAKSPDLFKTDAAYTKYINTDRSQRIAKGIAKLFPNSKIIREISQIDQNDQDTMQGKNANFYKPITVIDTLQENPENLYYKIDNGNLVYLSTTETINNIKDYLNQQGYTSEKRASMKDYTIGIKVSVNALGIDTNDMYKSLTSSIYPGAHGRYYDENVDGTIRLNIAKNK